MTITEAIKAMRSLVEQSSPTGSKYYAQRFISILESLKGMDLDPSRRMKIEQELEQLRMEQLTRRKELRTAYYEFLKFLRRQYELTPPRYYTERAMALGQCFGIVAGLVLLNNFKQSTGISLGLIGGLVLGYFIGQKLDKEAANAHKVLS